MSPDGNVVIVDGHPYEADAVVEALSPHMSAARVGRMEHALAHRLGSVALGLEDLHHSHNGSACLRTAEALGVQDVVAAELRHPYPVGEGPEGVVHRRIAMHAQRWVDLHPVETSAALLGWASARDMAVFGAGPRAKMTVDELPADRPVLLLFGNEAEGLRPETLAACTDTFRVPMYGFTESFNISVTVGMVLHQHGQRVRARLARDGRTGDLPIARQRAMLARWLVDDMRGAPAILRRKLR